MNKHRIKEDILFKLETWFDNFRIWCGNRTRKILSWNPVGRYIFGLFSGSSYSKQLNRKNKDYKLRRNIYNEGGTLEDFVKKQHRLHKWLKYMILLPILQIVDKFIGKYITNYVSPREEYKNLRLFNESFEKTLVQWTDMFTTHAGSNNAPSQALRIKSMKGMWDNPSVKALKQMKNVMLTMCQNDTAYLEFFNMLSFNFAINMNENHDEKHNHLFYTARSISDAYYFVLKDNHIIKQVKPLEGYEKYIEPIRKTKGKKK